MFDESDLPAKASKHDLITEGSRLVRAYESLHGQSTHVVKSLAGVVVRLRAKFEDKNGRPDLRGRSQAYREAAAQIYRNAGIPADASANLQAAVRHHVSTVLREYMNSTGFTAKDYEYYGLNPASMKDRNRLRAAASATASETVAPDDFPKLVVQAVEHAVQGLATVATDPEIRGSATTLPPGPHKKLHASLDEIEQYVALIRAAM